MCNPELFFARLGLALMGLTMLLLMGDSWVEHVGLSKSRTSLASMDDGDMDLVVRELMEDENFQARFFRAASRAMIDEEAVSEMLQESLMNGVMDAELDYLEVGLRELSDRWDTLCLDLGRNASDGAEIKSLMEAWLIGAQNFLNQYKGP